MGLIVSCLWCAFNGYSFRKCGAAEGPEGLTASPCIVTRGERILGSTWLVFVTVATSIIRGLAPEAARGGWMVLAIADRVLPTTRILPNASWSASCIGTRSVSSTCC